MRQFYQRLYGEHLKDIQYLETTPENAEIIKYASNAFLSMKVGFVNEISRICETVPTGDIEVVSKGLGLDKRIGSRFLSAGPGWGGSCFGKDVSALVRFANDSGVGRLDLISSSLRSNEQKKKHIAYRIEQYLGTLQTKTIAILGLAFKAGVDDARDSQSASVIAYMLSKGEEVKVYDPLDINNFRKEFSGYRVTYSDSVLDCVTGIDAVVLMTESKQFLEIEPSIFKERMRGKLVVDTRRLHYGKELEQQNGLQFIFLGVNPE